MYIDAEKIGKVTGMCKEVGQIFALYCAYNNSTEQDPDLPIDDFLRSQNMALPDAVVDVLMQMAGEFGNILTYLDPECQDYCFTYMEDDWIDRLSKYMDLHKVPLSHFYQDAPPDLVPYAWTEQRIVALEKAVSLLD